MKLTPLIILITEINYAKKQIIVFFLTSYIKNFISKKEMVSLMIALLLGSLYKNSNTFIPKFGEGELNYSVQMACVRVKVCVCERVFRAKPFCKNNGTESKFRLGAIVLI